MAGAPTWRGWLLAWLRRLSAPMFVRMRLFDPDPWLTRIVARWRPIFSAPMAAVAGVFVVVSALACLGDLGEMEFHPEWFRSWGNIVLLYAGILALKIIHESGHALIGRLLPKLDPVHKVTIIPRGRALGVTVSLPEKDRYSTDKIRMLSMIAMLFGGRIAEEVFMNQMTTGASNDFERATQIARDMVMRFGMSDVMGPMVYSENEGEVFLGRSVTKTTNISEETMRKVDAEVRRIIDEQYAIARKLIEDNKDKMHAMANALLEWETIDGEQIDDIMAGKPPRPPKDWTPSPSKPSGGNPPVSADGAPVAAS